MNPSPISKKDLIRSIIFSLVIILLIFIYKINDDRTKIVFCNVGQGDAAYIRLHNKIDVLIDAGPDKSVLSCLGKYMPFWDREIELAFLSHPNSDHYNGYFFIIDRYKIDKFITVKTPITPKTYKQLIDKIIDKKIKIEEAFAGKTIQAIQRFDVFWPPEGLMSNNDNDFSSVILFNGVLFTGDASSFVLSRLSHGSIGKINILKIPHHGSKNGLTKTFLDLADPRVAVISVGKNNSYGHPHQQILDMLKAKNIQIKRTDEDGDIVFNLKELI